MGLKNYIKECIRNYVLGRIGGCAFAGSLILLQACSINLSGQSSTVDISAIPSDYYQLIAVNNGIYQSSKITNYLTKLVRRLKKASGVDWNYRGIVILNTGNINAFATTKGYIFVTRGLLTLANNSAEVAAVLAHEIAHVTASHAAKRDIITRKIFRSAVDNSLVTGDPATLRAVEKESRRVIASFSQIQELEADRIGMSNMAKAGYDPVAAIDFLRNMERFKNLNSLNSRLETHEMLSSHPTTVERISQSRAIEAKLRRDGIKGNKEKQSYLEIINGIKFGDNYTCGYLRIKVVTVRPGDNVKKLTKAIVEIAGNKASFFRALNGIAARKQPKIGSLVKLWTLNYKRSCYE